MYIQLNIIVIIIIIMCFACRRDPSGTTIAFNDMMKKQIVMPAHLMDDGEHEGKTGRKLFKDFSSIAQTTGTYTGKVGHLKLLFLIPLLKRSLAAYPVLRLPLAKLLSSYSVVFLFCCNGHVSGCVSLL